MIKSTRLLYICLLVFTGFFYLAEGTSCAITDPAESWYKQGIKISGKVIDASTGEALLGVSVYIKNTTTGTITDENGNYSLTVSSKSDIIVFSFVSYEQFETVVGDQTTINVSLAISVTELEQVVVVGYGTQKKVDLTGAISTVDTKYMNLMPVASVVQALQGRASGIQIIQNSGAPGSSTTVNIRGMGTINNSEPLYVVDGMPLEDIRFLSMDDVKDISILKDAASCALYGSRGANGVILITTKQGDAGKIRVDFTAGFSFSEFWKSYSLMDTSEWIATRKTYYQGSPYEDYTKYFTTKYAEGDWFGEVTNRYGTNQKYNLTLSGGSEKTKFLMSITNTSDKGIVKKSSFRQTTFRLNIDHNLSKKITLRTNLNFANSSRIPTFEGRDNIFQQVLRQPPVDRIHEALYDNVDKPDSVVLGPSYIWGSLYAKHYSIDNKESTNNLTGLLNLSYNPLEAISINSRINVYANFWEGNYFYKSPKSFLYLFNSWDKNNITKQIKNNQTYRWSWENILHASKKFAGLHNIDFTGVVSFEGQSFKETDSKKYGYISDIDPLQYLNAGNNIEYTYEWAKLYTTMSFVGRVIYDFSDKYNLQLNARGDGSSFFSESRRWGFFPSISAGWSISKESFVKNLGLNWLSLLKFRVSYGLLGNNRIQEYSNYDLVKPLGYYLFGRVPVLDMGWSMSGYGNPDIMWEKTETVNTGIDLNLFNNRLVTSVDFFLKNTNDMLLQVPLPYSVGTGEGTNGPWQNTGQVRNSGVEFTGSYKQSLGKVNIKVSGNFIKFVNKVIKLGERNEPVYGGKIDDYYISNYLGYLTYTAPGYPIGQFYGYKTDGIFSTEEEPYIKYTPQGYNTKEGINMPQAGDFKFKDLNSDGKIDNNDMTILGSPHPDILYGFSLDIEYRGFDLNLTFQGSYGNEIFNITRFYTDHFYAESYGGKPINPVSGLASSSWTTDHQDRPYPAIKPNDFNNNYRASDFYLEDGSYLRLKNVQLGYSFPQKIIRKVRLNNLRTYISAYNLLTFTKYSGLDPEVGKDISNTSNNLFFGIDRGNYPVARLYSFGFVISF